MDRNLVIMKGNLYIAELKISYNEQGRATGVLTPYEITEYYDGSKTSNRTHTEIDIEVSHPANQTMEQLKAYDRTLVKKNENLINFKESELTITYDPTVYRYVVKEPRDKVMGLAEFHGDFNEGTKTFKFISCKDMTDDITMPLEQDNHEPHKTTIENFCTTYLRDVNWVEVSRVGRRW